VSALPDPPEPTVVTGAEPTVDSATPPTVSVIDVVTGAGVVVTVCVSLVTGSGVRLARGIAETLPLPHVPSLRKPGGRLDSLGALGREQRHALEQAGSRLLDRLVPKVVDATLQRVDLTSTIAQHVEIDTLVESVDLDRVIAAVDIDAIAARIDLDAIVDRIDLVALTEEIMNAIDIPEVIRESTNSVASESIREVRMQSISADEAVARVVDRVRLRRRQHRDLGPTATEIEIVLPDVAATPAESVGLTPRP
jgi:hypothetical protein